MQVEGQSLQWKTSFSVVLLGEKVLKLEVLLLLENRRQRDRPEKGPRSDVTIVLSTFTCILYSSLMIMNERKSSTSK